MLKKDQRITKKKEFDLVFKQGKSSYSPILGVKSLFNSLTLNRYGLIISNKVSKRANVRNNLRRKLRAQLYLLDSNIKPNSDILIIATIKAKDLTSAEIAIELKQLLKRSRLYNE
jgi:ribonuclease P protein component